MAPMHFYRNDFCICSIFSVQFGVICYVWHCGFHSQCETALMSFSQVLQLKPFSEKKNVLLNGNVVTNSSHLKKPPPEHARLSQFNQDMRCGVPKKRGRLYLSNSLAVNLPWSLSYIEQLLLLASTVLTSLAPIFTSFQALGTIQYHTVRFI